MYPHPQHIFGDVSPFHCGLFFQTDESTGAPVPLISVSIKAKVVNFVSEITVEQKYFNRESKPLEAVYFFPVEEEAAVVDFEAEIDGRKIKTEVKKKEEARLEYDEAISMGRTAFMLEETTPDIFKIKVGQLKPGSGAKIRIVYISELPVEEKAIRLTIPTTISPRYIPTSDNTEAAQEISSLTFSTASPASLSFDLEVVSTSKITSIESPSHKLQKNLNSGSNEDGQFNASAKLSGNVSDLDRDLVVLIENADPHQPAVFLEKSDEDPAMAGMISLVPSFKLKDQKVELIFLVDRSGSMHGSRIEQAKKALELFLHSLPMDCYFNIFSFGSSFRSLFSESKKYDDETLILAKNHVSSMSDDYGGTEIFQPLNFIFQQPRRVGHLRQIFILTDGEVSNGESVVQLVKRNSEQGRIFSLGLGSSASRHLVKGTARAGGGTSVFAMEGEDLRGKVLSQLKNALQPSISEVKVVWNGVDAEEETLEEVKEPEIEMQRTLLGYMKPKQVKIAERKVLKLEGQAPIKIRPIYDGSRLLVYRLFSATETEVPKSVTVTATTPDGPLSVELPIEKSSFISGNFVHQLAARKRIQDLEEILIGEFEMSVDDVENAVVELAIKYKLASKHTSFVGVDDKSPKNCFQLEMVTRQVANQVLFRYQQPPPPAPGSALFGSAKSSFGSAGLNQQSGNTSFGFGNSNSAQGSFPPPPQAPGCALFGSAQSFGFGLGGLSQKSENKPFGSGPGCLPPPPPCPGASLFGSSQSFGAGPALFQPNSGGREKVQNDQNIQNDELTDLIRLQAADGHFIWGNVISKRFGKSREEIVKSWPGPENERLEDIWMTVLAVVALEMITQQKDLWELVVQKARNFLAKHLDEDVMDKVFAEAKSLYSN